MQGLDFDFMDGQAMEIGRKEGRRDPEKFRD